MKIDSGRADQAASAYLSTLAPDKRRPAARLLELYVGEASTLDDFDWSGVSPTALIDARSRLAEKYSPSTVNSVLSCVRSVLRYALQLGILPAQHYLDSRDVAGVERQRLGLARTHISGLVYFSAPVHMIGTLGPQGRIHITDDRLRRIPSS